MMNFFKTMWLCIWFGLSTAASAATIEMEVNGLVCAFCAQGIEKSLKGFPATEDVYVSLEHRVVALALKDGANIEDSRLTQAITDAGYTIVAIRRTSESLDALKSRVSGHD